MQNWKNQIISCISPSQVESQIVTRRLNNMKRTEWNKKCRSRLSQHICKELSSLLISFTDIWQDNRLGISIDVSQVRLKTNPDDFYAWERIEEKEHLFTKNLSDLSINYLRELCEGVNKSFIAVRRPFVPHQLAAESGKKLHAAFLQQTNLWLTIRHKILDFLKPEVSFLAKINELHQKHSELTCKLRERESKAAIELQRRQMTECEISRLKAIV